MGKLIAINISEKRGTEKKEIQEAQLVTDFGIAGDAHAGKWHRQVSLLSFEKIEDFKARGARIENGAFGENLIVSGFDFKTLPLGTRFQIGDALLEMTQIGKQCRITSMASGCCLMLTTVVSGLMIPALHAAISARVSPRNPI